jgi:hypothetical protein
MATTAGIEPIADPRASFEADVDNKDDIFQRTWGLRARVDPTVTFEEYVYWAKIERAEEYENNRLYKEERGPLNFTKVIKNRFSKGIHHEEKKKREAALAAIGGITGSETDEKGGIITDISTPPRSGAVTEEEWKTAARALKTASWGTIFFLVTTDILGWSSTP